MSWSRLIAENRVTVLPPGNAELDSLRSIVDRSLRDVNAPGLSADTRFILAYDAARTGHCRCSSCARPAIARGVPAAITTLSSRSRRRTRPLPRNPLISMKRNTSEYDYAGGVSETDADGLLRTVEQFAIEAENWIARHHRRLAR